MKGLRGIVSGLFSKKLPDDIVMVEPLVEHHDLEKVVIDGMSLAEIVRNQAPPLELGIPLLSVDQLLFTQRDIIEQIQNIGVLDTERFRSLIMPVIQRFAAFVHLLPASENYHHHGTGGLLNHSLDVALRSGRLVTAKYLQSPKSSPSLNNTLKERWPYVAMFAGLCHDLAKPFTDFVVTDMDGAMIWDPFSESLLAWAQRNRLSRYRYTWVKNRYGKHELMAGALLHQILTNDFASWLRTGGSTITYPMFQYISYGSASPNSNVLRSIVSEADQRSTITDVHRWQEARKEIGMKVKPERYLLNIIKEQFLSGEWTVNDVDAMAYIIEGDLYLDWDSASEFLIFKLEELELNGLLDTKISIANLLISANIAEKNLTDPNRPRRLWDIEIVLQSGEEGEVVSTKRALRFVSPDYVLDRLYESSNARILKQQEDASAEESDKFFDQEDNALRSATADVPQGNAAKQAKTPESDGADNNKSFKPETASSSARVPGARDKPENTHAGSRTAAPASGNSPDDARTKPTQQQKKRRHSLQLSPGNLNKSKHDTDVSPPAGQQKTPFSSSLWDNINSPAEKFLPESSSSATTDCEPSSGALPTAPIPEIKPLFRYLVRRLKDHPNKDQWMKQEGSLVLLHWPESFDGHEQLKPKAFRQALLAADAIRPQENGDQWFIVNKIHIHYFSSLLNIEADLNGG
jgi:conjugal transfer pilus assembly protein TraI